MVNYNRTLILHDYGDILGSRPWPFGVTWRHRSRDHWTRNIWFPICDPLKVATMRDRGVVSNWNHPSISRGCWDIACQTFSYA